MNRRQLAAGLVLAAAATGLAEQAQAAKAPTTWDGLVRVKSKRLKYVYLLPGADFRIYKSVMVDPTEVAFEKDYVRDFNRTTMTLEGRIRESDVQKVVKEAIEKSTDILEEAYAEGGYPVVKEGGEDVLRIKTGVLNIRVTSPDRMTSARSHSFSDEAGEATFVIEARDSLAGTLLGRAVDGRVIGDTSVGWRNRVTNRADFRQEMKRWAETSVRGLAELKAQSPINEAGALRRS